MIHSTDAELRLKLERIRNLATNALAEDVTHRPNLLRVALSRIEDEAKVPSWPV